MKKRRQWAIGWAAGALATCAAAAQPWIGPFYTEYSDPIGKARRIEAAGPFWAQEREIAPAAEAARRLTLAPFFSIGETPKTDASSFDLFYPVVTYDRFGTESRFQFFQLFSVSGGESAPGRPARTYTLFPFFFARRSEVPAESYTALWPIGGVLKNRFFRDEIRFALWPLYVRTRKRDVVTINAPAPFFHVRRGERLRGWQLWPLYGWERRDPPPAGRDAATAIPGHESRFVLWPFYSARTDGLGSTNVSSKLLLFPFYARERSALRRSATYLWPFGLSLLEDREKAYRQTSLLWPVFSAASGKGKKEIRLWPLFGDARYPARRSRFVLWPLWTEKTQRSEGVERRSTRGALFLYRNVRETETKSGRRRGFDSLWPLYLHKIDKDGVRRLQIFAPLEPFAPHNESIARLYSPLWAVWRAESNADGTVSTRSLLWNLYRCERTPGRRRWSALFGLIQGERGAGGSTLRVLFIPIAKRRAPPARAAVPPRPLSDLTAHSAAYVSEHR